MPGLRSSEQRQQLWKLLGYEYQHTHFTAANRKRVQHRANSTIEEWEFTSDTGCIIPATLLLPEAASTPRPVVLYCHAHGGRYDIGRAELINGRKALPSPYDQPLLALGYAVLCVEMPCFGERQHHEESSTAKACQWRGTTLFGWMLGELKAAISYLTSRDDIDAARIATLGISMGGTHAWWLAALDERIRCAASLCCFADLGKLIDAGLHEGHGHYMTVPGLLLSHSTAQIAALTAPRAQFFGVGMQDWSTPPESFGRARTELESCYRATATTDQLTFFVEPEMGHVETPAMRSAVLGFLQHNL